MIKNRIWQLVSVMIALAMVVAALPGVVSAQEGAVSSTSVQGELAEQFAKHYLTLRSDGSNEMQVTMLANPNDNQFLQRQSGFVVFNADQFNAYVRVGGVAASKENTATGVDATNSDGLLVERAPVGEGTYTLVVYNDSTVPMEYTLSVNGGVIVDESGEQVMDATDATPEAATETTEEAAAEEATAEEPAAEETPEAEATEEATATVEATEAATATPAASGQSRVLRVSTLEGELNERFAKHYYELNVTNIRSAVDFTFTYDPQDRPELDGGLNVYVLTEQQFRGWATGGPGTGLSQNNSLTLELQNTAGKVKTGNIANPLGTYVVIVDNASEIPAAYELSVDNAVLIDDSAQSTTAQELGSVTPAATEDEAEETEEAADDTTTAAAATPAAPTADAITVPGSYTVASGDTIGTIARRAYGDIQLYDEVCAYNNIADCNVIEVGDVIELPAQAELGTGSTAPAATAAPAVATPAPTAAESAEATAEPTAEATAEPTTEPTEEAAEEPTATPTAVSEESDADQAESSAPASGNIVETAATYNALETLGLLLDLLGLEADQANNIGAILTSDGPYTFFAPTDTAFTSLPEATLNNLIADPTALAAVLRYHIVEGSVLAADLSDGMVVETLNGALLEVRISNGVVTVGGATVTQPDIAATNGVIHVIDTVLVPPAE